MTFQRISPLPSHNVSTPRSAHLRRALRALGRGSGGLRTQEAHGKCAERSTDECGGKSSLCPRRGKGSLSRFVTRLSRLHWSRSVTHLSRVCHASRKCHALVTLHESSRRKYVTQMSRESHALPLRGPLTPISSNFFEAPNSCTREYKGFLSFFIIRAG